MISSALPVDLQNLKYLLSSPSQEKKKQKAKNFPTPDPAVFLNAWFQLHIPTLIFLDWKHVHGRRCVYTPIKKLDHFCEFKQE